MSASINSIPAKDGPDAEANWDPFLTSNTTFPVDLLARLSKVGLHPSTLIAGQLVCSGFALEPAVQEQIRGYLENLSCVESYREALCFGFEGAHLINNLADLEHGTTCLALCACLAVSYDSLYAAEVLRELFKARKLPVHLSPPSYQWQALVKLCAGTLSTSKFSNLVDELISQAIPHPTASCYNPTCCTTALAETLSELADISRGMLTNVSIVGGLDCLWLGTIAEWLFCLNVEITSSGQKVRDCSKPEENPAQVTILFEKDPQLPLAPACRLLPHGDVIHKTFGVRWNPFLGGCSPWDRILSSTFGAEFTELLQEPLLSHFATRLFLASEDAETIYHRGFGENGVRGTSPVRTWYYHSSIGGRGFLEFAARRLPELIPVVNHIVANEPQAGNRNDADREIKHSCACVSCQGGNEGKASSDPEENNSEELRFCRLGVVDTTLLLLGLLTTLEVDESLQPRAIGLKMLSRRQKGGFNSSLLTTALAVFGGTVTKNSLWTIPCRYYSESTLAIAFDGVCVFPTVFEGMDIPPERAVKYRVMPGHITFEGATRSEILTLQPPNNRKKLKDCRDVSYELVVREMEYPGSIQAAFKVYCSEEADEQYLEISDLVRRIGDSLTKPITCQSLCNYWNFPHHPREALTFRSVDGEDTETQHEERIPFTGGWCLVGNNDSEAEFPLSEFACPLDMYVLSASLPSLYFYLSKMFQPSLTFVDATCLSCIARFAWTKACLPSYSLAFDPGGRITLSHFKEAGEFIEENYSISRIQHSGSILEDALTPDNFSTMQFMLDRRYEIDFKDVRGKTALHRAAASGHNRRLTVLLCAGADINTKSLWDRYPRNTLDHAINNGNISTAKLLLSSYANHIPQKRIRSAFLRAIRYNDAVVANLLLEHGAEPGPTTDTPRNYVPLHRAIENNHLDMVALLLARGTDLNTAHEGRPPLSYAAKCGTVEIVKILLDNGADMQQKELLEKYRVLWSAYRHDNYAVIPFLVSRGASW